MTHPTRIECVDCSRLPTLPANEADVDEDVEYRPRVARPVVAGNSPRSWRCASHLRAFELAAKASAHDARVARTYGLERGEYAALLAYQGGKCAICQVATGKVKRLAVDHDHDTGEARGILCGRCNHELLGRYPHDALVRAIDYLRDPPRQRMRREAS